MDTFLLPQVLHKPFKGILFDLDGTLLNSEQMHHDAFDQAMKEFGYDFDQIAEKVVYKGSFRKLFTEVAELLNLDSDLFETIYARKMEITLDLHEGNVDEVDGVVSFLELMRERCVPMGVVTNSDRAYADHALATHEMTQFFSTVITLTELNNPKPDPQGYLQGASDLGFQPSDIVVFENNDPGIAAGKAAGMPVVAIRTTDVMGYSHYELADHAIDDFSDTSIDELQFETHE